MTGVKPVRGSGRFDYGAGTDAAGAYAYGLAVAAGCRHPDFLQIRKPAPTVFVVGMANVVAGSGFFSANFTFFRHGKSPCWFFGTSPYTVFGGCWQQFCALFFLFHPPGALYVFEDVFF